MYIGCILAKNSKISAGSQHAYIVSAPLWSNLKQSSHITSSLLHASFVETCLSACMCVYITCTCVSRFVNFSSYLCGYLGLDCAYLH